jgi:hypothetical protein
MSINASTTIFNEAIARDLLFESGEVASRSRIIEAVKAQWMDEMGIRRLVKVNMNQRLIVSSLTKV